MLIAGAAPAVDIANYVSALFEVYILIADLRLHPAQPAVLVRAATAVLALDRRVLGFLRDVSEPYLRIFRRLIPPIGMIDLTPMIAIIVLIFLRTIVVNAIHG